MWSAIATVRRTDGALLPPWREVPGIAARVTRSRSDRGSGAFGSDYAGARTRSSRIAKSDAASIPRNSSSVNSVSWNGLAGRPSSERESFASE